MFWVSERIFALGAAEEFSEGSGRLDLGFEVSINFDNGDVVVKGRMEDLRVLWAAGRTAR